MGKIETADFILDSDEPTYGMQVYEDESGFCTRILVLRGGNPVGLVIHHGHNPEYTGKIPPMNIPSIEGENPVGLMLELSEQHRHDLRWYRRAKELQDGSTLIKDILDQEWELVQTSNNRSNIGPYQSTQRNGFSRETANRRYKDKRADVTGKITSYRK